MPGQARVRAVVLDVNETLFPLDPIRRRLDEAGIGADRLEGWFTRVLRDGFAAAATGGFVAFPTLASHHLERLGVDAGVADPEATAGEILAGFEEVAPHPDVAPALKTLRAADVRVATLTNGTAAITRGLLDRHDLTGDVELMMEVAEAHIWKPHPDAYRYALTRLGLPAGDVAMVAVHPWDVHGAAAAGMVGAWVDRDGRGAYPPGFEQPAVSGRDLVEVAERLTPS